MPKPTKTQTRLIDALCYNREGREMAVRDTLAQIGAGVFLATCGGAWASIRNNEGDTVGMLLLCGRGRAVEVVLNFWDYYTVRRVRLVTTGEKAGEVVEEYHAGDEVDCFQVSEVVYNAGCWQ